MEMNRRRGFQLGWTGVFLSALCCAGAGSPSPSAPAIAPPPLPAIRSLKLEPAALTLKDGRDERRVLVSGKTEGDKSVDLTLQAVLKTDSPIIEVDAQGYIRPKAKGVAEVTVSAAGHHVKLPVTVESAEMPPVRFVRDIAPLMSKAGCNAGTCHGSAKGKNGFKLSLRGYASPVRASINCFANGSLRESTPRRRPRAAPLRWRFLPRKWKWICPAARSKCWSWPIMPTARFGT